MPTVWGHKTEGGGLSIYRKFAPVMEQIPTGVRLRISIDRDRNGRFSAMYHVLLGLVSDAVNRGPAETDIDALKRWVKLKTGRYDVVKLPQPGPGGETIAIEYHSTSFAKMGEEEFHQFALDTVEMLRAEFTPWLERSAEWGDIAAIMASIRPEHGERNDR